MKRTIALLLALLMLTGIPVPALADESVQPTEQPSVEQTAFPDSAVASDAPESASQPEEAEAEPTETPAEGTTAPSPEAGEPTASPETEATEAPAGEPTPTPEGEPSPSPEAEEDEGEEHMLALISELPATTGELDIAITAAMDLGGWTPVFQAALSGPAIHAREVPADGTRQSLKDLAAGDYTLTVTGQGFAAYTQSIHIDACDGVFIQLTVGQLAGYEQGPHPGVLQIGDVDGDGDVDRDDEDWMMRAVDGQAVEGTTDLNGDGVTDLADAEYLARGLDVGKLAPEARAATEERFVPAAAIASLVEGSTQLTGDVNDLFRDNGQTVSLGTADEQPISEEAPVEVSFGMAEGAHTDAIVIGQSNITAGELLVVIDDGQGGETTVKGIIGDRVPLAGISALVRFLRLDDDHSGKTVGLTRDAKGDLTLDLGGQVAVKRVTLRITGTEDNGSLAEISQVEFVNGMEDRIKEPALDIPQNVSAAPGSRQFTASWTACVNITGYEVEVSAEGAPAEIIPVAGTSLTVTSFGKDELRNYTAYSVRVQSVNGSWKSGWSDAVTVTPKPTAKPDKPDNVKAVGGYQTVTVSWKNMKDTTAYDLYYKEKTASSFIKIADLTVTSYILSGLNSKKATVYEVYVVGKNEFGESAPSMHASAATTTLDPPDMPRFNMINRDGSGKPGSDHILSAEQTGATLIDSPRDTETGTAWATVDGAPASYYYKGTWDDGGFNHLNPHNGIIYTFDGFYELDTIAVMPPQGMGYGYAKIRWWDEDGQEHLTAREYIGVETRRDSQGREYCVLRLPEPIRTNKLQLGLSRGWAGNNQISIAEVFFYHYDPLKRELMDLYEDDLHTTLKDTVTEEQLNALKAKIEASVDPVTGEVNPEKEQLLKEWETAWKIYHDQFMGKVTLVHTGITGSGDDHGFGGLNAWQPLGVTAAAGETVTVYVGHNNKKTGSNTNLQLVATQYHAEASAMSKVVMTLKVGANQVQIPKVWTTSGIESGGALYVQYTGGAGSADQYAVRVSGGVSVPVLDLYQVRDTAQRLERVTAYLDALKEYAADMQALHSQVHQGDGSVSTEVDLDYDAQNCILGASDIMLDTMMLSLPAQQIVSGCGGDARVLLNSLSAMENMMALFYQHKGLNANAKNAVDRIPNRHLNIRYQRMFSGAFMYASGDHIGIDWNETDDMAGCSGVRAGGNGMFESGAYFGWGIAHEIGHDINQGCYAIAEVTNNYFAVLAQAEDTNGSVRFEYDKVYEKVTSGAKGPAGNVFTQLGMYWQLHLAYDRGYNYKTYADYDEQLAGLFFARVDTYARTPSRAPAPKGVALTLEGADVDQTLMRLACAAAERNILEFFQRWGKTPDETTRAYAAQFPAESRAIYYVCDDSRRYTIEQGGESKLAADGSTAAVASVTVKTDPDQANKVDIAVAPNNTVPPEEILGYEIVRCTTSGGRVEKRTVGFTTEPAFSDVVYSMNNRVVSYEVTLVDKYLNRSAAASSEAVKIQHEGDLDKTDWSVTVAGLVAEPIRTGGTMLMPEVVETEPATLAIDGKTETVYMADVGWDAAIELDFRDTQVVTGFRYTAGAGTPIAGYTVDVRQNGEWVRAGEGELNGTGTVYFSNTDGKYVSTYAADGLRLTLTGQVGEKISVAELDVLGLTGDNVDIGTADGKAGAGYLSADFSYGKDPKDVIPAGSLVFTGSYKGNAAYNVVMLFDQDGNVVAGHDGGGLTARQIILADLPAGGPIEDVRDGIWVYWIEPAALKGFRMPEKVRAELYRVNDAMSNEGERLVSDSLFAAVPAQPGSITLSNSSVG